MHTLHIDTLPAATRNVAQLLQENNPTFLKQFYLSGGTALSLQIGHRESEDLDFFIAEPFDPLKIQKDLLKFGDLKQTEIAAGTLNTFINGVQLQFLEYPYKLLKPMTEWQRIQLSSIEDIACTKIQTIGMRGSKKDFVDLYFLLRMYSINELFNLIKDKYENIEYNQAHILKSLTYFDDAEEQPMPRMHRPVKWKEIKRTLIKCVKNFNLNGL